MELSHDFSMNFDRQVPEMEDQTSGTMEKKIETFYH